MNSQIAAYKTGTALTRTNRVRTCTPNTSHLEERCEKSPALHFRSAFDLGVTVEYATDFWQRSILFLDILRRRGNQQAEMDRGRSMPWPSTTTSTSCAGQSCLGR
jgi:hypothetical protein